MNELGITGKLGLEFQGKLLSWGKYTVKWSHVLYVKGTDVIETSSVVPSCPMQYYESRNTSFLLEINETRVSRVASSSPDLILPVTAAETSLALFSVGLYLVSAGVVLMLQCQYCSFCTSLEGQRVARVIHPPAEGTGTLCVLVPLSSSGQMMVRWP